MTSADTLCQELARINDVVAAARDLVADGQLINVAPLEGEIGRICGGLGSLTGAEAEKVKAVLLSLMDELDRLAGEMRTRQDEYERELRALATHRKAAHAYHKVPPKKTAR